jgi:hypothetical protein
MISYTKYVLNSTRKNRTFQAAESATWKTKFEYKNILTESSLLPLLLRVNSGLGEVEKRGEGHV